MNGSVNIVRSTPRRSFTALPNSLANDEQLSARALGILVYILTKPSDWNVIPAQLGKRFGMSYRVVLKIMSELIEAGYVKRELLREGRWIVGTRYLVADEPWSETDEDSGQCPRKSEQGTTTLSESAEQSRNGRNRRASILQHADRATRIQRTDSLTKPLSQSPSPVRRACP